jgi:hypothetical protein
MSTAVAKGVGFMHCEVLMRIAAPLPRFMDSTASAWTVVSNRLQSTAAADSSSDQ